MLGAFLCWGVMAEILCEDGSRNNFGERIWRETYVGWVAARFRERIWRETYVGWVPYPFKDNNPTWGFALSF